MEISKGLQQEIQLVQNKLKNAIRDHQICVGKLKDDPDNGDILGRIQEIQLNIVSLGRCQKQVVQRLRMEVEAFKADNTNDVKVSFASLLGLNNNNHITANNEATTDEISEVKVVTNGLDSGRHAKEDYEDFVRNGDVASSPRDNLRNKIRSVSVETLSAEDEIMEVEVDDNSRETRRQDSSERFNERKVNSTAQLNFLEILGLITTSRFTDLQNRRAERKRRSTANPQFVYSNWEIPTKRKRHNYLQSACNVPQTRQTTARLNGPSPPPGTNNKSASGVAPPKSTSPPTRTIAKSLIPTQKAANRPNILRNMSESRVYVNKGKVENGNGQAQLSSSAKSSQQSNSKTVHIPGLPSGLIIERIENDSAVCINCRNPGTLTNCDNCEANYHVSCHSISPPPPRLCPKCALRLKDGTPTTSIKKNEELEEKERERYEQRERNSDLRLQVYELEKRSQLLGQSIQLQHRTRQELLGKQERTQRSIKRLVDFIKLVQLRNTNRPSPPAVASTSYHHRPSSSRSLRSPSSERPVSIISPVSSSTTNRSRSSSPMLYPTTPLSSSAISTQDRASPTYRSQTPVSPINYRTTARKSLSGHISEPKRSRNPESNKSTRQRKNKTSNAQRLPETLVREEEVGPKEERRISISRSSPDVSPSRSPEAGRSPPHEQSLVSIVSSTRTTNRTQPRLSTRTTTTWTNYRSARPASENRRTESSNHSRSEHRRNSDARESSPRPRTCTKHQSKLSSSRRAHSPVTNAGQSLVHYSTQCSQAITSPITSPIVLTSRGNGKETHEPRIVTKTTAPTSPSGLDESQTASHTVPTSPDPPNT